jgi:hypothetical protein
MSHEAKLNAFLDVITDMRIDGLTKQANRQPDICKINHALQDFMKAVTDENIRAVLMEYEALKNDYIPLLARYLYIAGAKDSLTVYGLLSKQIYSESPIELS